MAMLLLATEEEWINRGHPEQFRQRRIASVLHARRHVVARTVLRWDPLLRGELARRGIHRRYLEFIDGHAEVKFVAYAVSTAAQLPKELVEAKVNAIVLWYAREPRGAASAASLRRTLDYLTRETENARDGRDTKFTYYLKVYMTMRTLQRVRSSGRIPEKMLRASVMNGDSRFVDDDDDGFIRTLSVADNNSSVAKIMARMRATLIQLVTSMRFENLHTGHEEGSDAWRLWERSFQRCIEVTTTRTVFVEKFIGVETRAYNVLKGHSIVMTIRNVIRPLDGPLLDERGLLLLYLHELGHTLAPAYDEDGAHGAKFQVAMQFLFSEAHRLGMVSLACRSYGECEMYIRETHQDSSLEMPIDDLLLSPSITTTTTGIGGR